MASISPSDGLCRPLSEATIAPLVYITRQFESGARAILHWPAPFNGFISWPLIKASSSPDELHQKASGTFNGPQLALSFHDNNISFVPAQPLLPPPLLATLETPDEALYASQMSYFMSSISVVGRAVH